LRNEAKNTPKKSEIFSLNSILPLFTKQKKWWDELREKRRKEVEAERDSN
jgi:hypothetical protein